jgi:DNA-binding NarL/FixJ family response regulator
VIRVLLVDDHAVVRRGLRAFVETEPALKVIGEASDGQQALDLLREWHTLGRPLPHVVLMDLRMPRMDGTMATKRMTAGYPDVRVVILTSFGERNACRARSPRAPPATCSRTPSRGRWPPRRGRCTSIRPSPANWFGE